MTRRLAAVVLLAALAAPAAALATWLPPATTHACALACPLGHGGACCEQPQAAGKGPSFHRCAREESAVAPSPLPPALPITLVRSTRHDPSEPADVPANLLPASAFPPAVEHVPLLLA